MNEAILPSELARRVEVTITHPAARRADIENLCARARALGVYGLGVNSSRVDLARSLLEESHLKVIGLVGFPWGASDSDVKRFETEAAIDLGAQELEVMFNIGRVKDGQWAYLLRELRDLAEAADERSVLVALEISLLTPDELARSCELILDSGVSGVSTGCGDGPTPSAEEVRVLRTLTGSKSLIKAAGNELSMENAKVLLEAGADRVGVLARLSGNDQPPSVSLLRETQ